MTQDSKPAIISANGCGCLVLLILLTPVIGVLVFLSFFLCNANGARQSEGKQYVASMNRAQQAYFAEKSAFATSIADLGIGIQTETTNYKYAIHMTKKDILSYGISKQEDVKSYVGGVFLVPAYRNASKDEMTTTSILCEADDRGTIKLAEPIYQNGKLICGKGTTQVTKQSN